MHRLLILCLAMFIIPFTALGHPSQSEFRYRFAGPPGNRTDAIAASPNNSQVVFIGAASGGIWKTTDGGIHWKPVFDHTDVQSIGALAIAPSAPNEIWAGTGETFYIRPETSIGNGIWYSHDNGHHWEHMGLAETGRIGRIIIDPRNANIVYACAAGSGFGKSTHRGVYRTTDGGNHWKKVLYVGPHTGCSDLAMDPQDPKTLFAGLWEFDIHPWKLASGGPNGGVYVTHDGGRHWKKLKSGLPTGNVGKVGVAISRSNPRVVYALISQRNGPGLYQSRNGGQNWRLVSRNHDMLERPPYYGRFTVAPNDSDELYFTSVRLTRSRNGGRTLQRINRCRCGDTHAIWINPKAPKTIWVADDLGVVVTHDGGKDWHRIRLPNAQIYHVYTDRAIPYHIMGNRQDGFSYWGPSDSLTAYGITPGDWHEVGGCESGFTIPDRWDHSVWSGCYEGGLTRFNLRTMHGQDVRVWPVVGFGWPPKALKNRWNWTMPLAVAPWKPHAVYVGSQYVYRTTNGGHSWQRISPDLTRNNKAHEGNSGGIVNDEIGTFTSASLSIIAPSKKQAGVIWTGSYDGEIHITRDNGIRWHNITPSFLQKEGGSVSDITPSPFKAGVAWVSIDRHMLGDSDPHIFLTRDYGRHWQEVDHGITHSVFSYVHTVAADPARRGLLFAGTENAVYVSFDSGQRWRPFQYNLPHAPVYWLTIQPVFHDLAVATFGRGFWILDDIKPLETDGAAALDIPRTTAALLPPRATWRFRLHDGSPGPADGSVIGQNPPYGAIIDYLLPKQAKKPISLIVTNAKGIVVRRFHSGKKGTMPTKPGLNRLVWNLRYPSIPKGRLLRPPPQAPWDRSGNSNPRPIVSWDLDLTQRGPLVPPGRYTLTLTVGRSTLHQSLVIRKDPHTQGTTSDIKAQTRLALAIYQNLKKIVKTVNDIERLRQQIHGLERRISENGRHNRSNTRHILIRANQRLRAIEGRLFDIYLTGSREDAFRQPMRLYGRLSALLKEVENASSDYAPTVQQITAHELLQKRLDSQMKRYHHFIDLHIPALNRALSRSGIQTIGLG